MQANEYQELALRTAAQRGENALVVAGLGLCGEAGEFAEIVKKNVFHGHTLDTEKALKELGDVAWYLALAADSIGYSLNAVFERNITKLKERYPDGFTTERSINRAPNT
jgi:NTP pyrophosphatase (non-canonical NTP hydrolase)